MTLQKKSIRVDAALIAGLFGRFDENIKKIEKALSVNIVNRDEDILIYGEDSSIEKAAAVINKITALLEGGGDADEQAINYIISSLGESDFDELEKMGEGFICSTVSGRPVKPKTMGQKKYVEQMKKKTIVFGVGPAGTGKTYLAMAMAITAFKRNEVARIVLTRPAIEAGEKLGFLPGDLQQKVDPYLRPLYDALYDIMGAESFQKNMEKGAIEVAPLAYMRGRTLDNSYIVLDEAQNTTPEQMKMFLTRIGFGSKAVVTGDITQIDLADGKRSGLVEALEIVKDIEEIGITMFTNKDVVRHPLVQKIIQAYEKKESAIRKKTGASLKPGKYRIKRA